MFKKIALFVALLSISAFFSGCSGPITDRENYNYTTVSYKYDSLNYESVEFYIDSTEGMKEIAKDNNFKDILLCSYDAVQKTWPEIKPEIYSVDDNITLQDISYIDQFNPSLFSSNSENAIINFINAKNNIKDNKPVNPIIRLIITDLQGQLDDYHYLADMLNNNIFDKDLSLAILAVSTKKPVFIFAVGHDKDIADYLNTFYKSQDIINFMYSTKSSGADPINCTYFSPNCGLLGISYKNILPIERGTAKPFIDKKNNYYIENPYSYAQNPSLYEQENEELPLRGAGSFSKLRIDYTSELMRKYVRGTVNFTYDKTAQDENDSSPWIQLELPKDADKNLKVSDIKYIAFKSLYYNDDDLPDKITDIAGKIKLQIPLETMPKMDLSSVVFDMSTDVYTNYGIRREFFPANTKEQKCFETVWSDGAYKVGDKYKLSNNLKSAVVNIFVDDISSLPKISKINIHLIAHKDKEYIPPWILTDTYSDYKNLYRFFLYLNSIQADNNFFEGIFTVYICAGDKYTQKNALLQSYEEYKIFYLNSYKEEYEEYEYNAENIH